MQATAVDPVALALAHRPGAEASLARQLDTIRRTTPEGERWTERYQALLDEGRQRLAASD